MDVLIRLLIPAARFLGRELLVIQVVVFDYLVIGDLIRVKSSDWRGGRAV